MFSSRITAMFLGASLAAAAVGAEIRVAGSDLLGVDFSKALYEFAGRHDLSLALALDGSRSGFDQLKAGRADLALLMVPVGEESTLAGFESFTLGYHLVVVLVPTTLPLEQVTLDELGGIFGEGGSSNFSRWSDLGLVGERAISAIEPHVPAVGRGIAVEYFRHYVLHGRAFKSSVARYATRTELRNRLGPDSRAIAVAPARIDDPMLKVVSVALRAGEPAFLPTLENVHSGDYPLRLPLRLVCRRESLERIRPLLRHFFSDDVAAQLVLADILPLPVSARRNEVLEAEKR